MAKDKDNKSVEVIPPAYIRVPSSYHTRALEVQDHLLATDVVNRYVKSEVDAAKNKDKEKDKEKHEKEGSKMLLTILLWLVLSPIIFAFEWAIVTSIYNSIFK